MGKKSQKTVARQPHRRAVRLGFGTGAVAKGVRANRSVPLRHSTVTETTRARYQHAVGLFLSFVAELRPDCMSQDTIDELLCRYIEYVWANGDSAFFAVYAMAGIGWYLPSVKGTLANAKVLLRTWQKLEPPTRTTPFTPEVVLGLAGLAARAGCLDICAFLLVGFDAFLRTGELFSMVKEDVVFFSDRVVLRIRFPKTGQKAGEHESVILCPGVATKWLRRLWDATPSGHRLLHRSPRQAREILTELLCLAELAAFGFGWYSARRGGATHYFGRTQNMEATLIRGRWAATKTARVYISAAVAELVRVSLPPRSRLILQLGARALV